MCPDPKYEEPFFWWGPGWDTPVQPGIGDLLRNGTIDTWSAALLWAVLARRKSLAVIAGPSGVGKTTVLTALLDFLPLEMRRVYTRGCFETCSFLSDPDIQPAATVVLINEISPHLPVYLWGPAVGRLLDAVDRGFTLLATAHAETVPEFVGALTGSPLRIPAARVAAFEFVAVMERSAMSQSGRRLRGVWRLSETRGGVGMEPLRQPTLHNISHEYDHLPDTGLSLPFPAPELGWRGQVIEDLRDGRIQRLPAQRWPPEHGSSSRQP